MLLQNKVVANFLIQVPWYVYRRSCWKLPILQ